MYEPPSLMQFGSYCRVEVQSLESSKKVFVIRHFKSHGGLHCRESKKVMGARESPSHVMSFSHGSFQARTAHVGLQFVAKENAVL